MTRLLASLAAVVLLLAFAAPAHAVPAVTDETFYFTGTCSDCSGTVGAQLILESTYTLGSDDLTDSFVSFTYDGSNLYPGGFTVTAADLGFIDGSIGPTFPGEFSIELDGGGASTYFSSSSNGAWCVYNGCALDRGVNGTWSQTNSVPEPVSIAVFGAGLVAVGARRRWFARRDAVVR